MIDLILKWVRELQLMFTVSLIAQFLLLLKAFHSMYALRQINSDGILNVSAEVQTISKEIIITNENVRVEVRNLC